MEWRWNASSAASELMELGILTIPSYFSMEHEDQHDAYILPVFLFEDIKNDITFKKFKSYTKENIPHLFGLVNSMGKYQIIVWRCNSNSSVVSHITLL